MCIDLGEASGLPLPNRDFFRRKPNEYQWNYALELSVVHSFSTLSLVSVCRISINQSINQSIDSLGLYFFGLLVGL